jgi:hypothetical protein
MTSSGDDKPAAPVPQGTIQIDALTDVQLIDQLASESSESEAPVAVSKPPPLPKKKPAPIGRTIGLTLLAAIVGGSLAFAAVHYLFPSPPVAAPVAPVVAPPASAPPTTAPAVRRVTLDDEPIVIRTSAPPPS